ncbi:MAG: hypothetical protein HKM04_00155 [Legionellales bacterium]|nr:hypothetical protein [Legionellales bacterium]
MARRTTTEDFYDRFENKLTKFIEEKERLNSKNAREGGRGFRAGNIRAVINPHAFLRAAGAKIKNVTHGFKSHQDALNERETFLTYAKYLNWLVREAKNHPNDTKYLMNLHKEIISIGQFLENKGYKSKFMDELLMSAAKASGAILEHNNVNLKAQFKAMDENQKKFTTLWPMYLELENMQECFLSGIDYSASSVYKFMQELPKEERAAAGLKSAESLEDVKKIFDYYTQKQLELKAENAPPVQVSQEDKIAERQQLAKVDKAKPAPVSLITPVKLADRAMEMDLQPEKFKSYRIESIDSSTNQVKNAADNPHSKAGETLKDGWYQYVILAKEGKQDDQEFRYFPCSKVPPEKAKPWAPYEKYVAHSQIAGGQPIYAGGAFEVKKGVITKIDNSSGHYPTGQKNMDYSQQRLHNMGMCTNNLKLVVAPTISGDAKKARNKKKFSAAGYAAYSAGGNDLAQRAEDRPVLPHSKQDPKIVVYEQTQRSLARLEETIQHVNAPRPQEQQYAVSQKSM